MIATLPQPKDPAPYAGWNWAWHPNQATQALRAIQTATNGTMCMGRYMREIFMPWRSLALPKGCEAHVFHDASALIVVEGCVQPFPVVLLSQDHHPDGTERAGTIRRLYAARLAMPAWTAPLAGTIEDLQQGATMAPWSNIAAEIHPGSAKNPLTPLLGALLRGVIVPYAFWVLGATQTARLHMSATITLSSSTLSKDGILPPTLALRFENTPIHGPDRGLSGWCEKLCESLHEGLLPGIDPVLLLGQNWTTNRPNGAAMDYPLASVTDTFPEPPRLSGHESMALHDLLERLGLRGMLGP